MLKKFRNCLAHKFHIKSFDNNVFLVHKINYVTLQKNTMSMILLKINK